MVQERKLYCGPVLAQRFTVFATAPRGNTVEAFDAVRIFVALEGGAAYIDSVAYTIPISAKTAVIFADFVNGVAGLSFFALRVNRTF
jgi:hypothetical protein